MSHALIFVLCKNKLNGYCDKATDANKKRKCSDGKEASLYLNQTGVAGILKTQEEIKMTKRQQNKHFNAQLNPGVAVLTNDATHELRTQEDVEKFKKEFKLPKSGWIVVELSPEWSISFDIIRGTTQRIQKKKIPGSVPLEIAERISDEM